MPPSYLLNPFEIMSYIMSYCEFTPESVLLNGKKIFDTKGKFFIVNNFLSALYEHLEIDYRRFYKMDALSKFGFLASEILLAGSDREQPKTDMGIILFNDNASLNADRNFQKTIQHKDDFFPSPAEFVYTLPNIVTGEIAIRNKIYGETIFYITHYVMADIIENIVDDVMSSTGLNCALVGWLHVDVKDNTMEGWMLLCATSISDIDTEEDKQILKVSKGLEYICSAKNTVQFNQYSLSDLNET